ncbi:uncharacterized protein L3040_007130 [Drepanopeziza brunnea f. sp. 'multigermtubi']|uniref:Uncharacterized protein n=1 Tax=Marssonina brunnea f. sp. multigermtubi (strain MB_m1) TaxID=1072389 RepID=K1W7J1_MARBU|nr:uncharacterized protein MBM_08812 [Drepanopeziza brunnea f. sp. 'multigermtubi' MB_m1]EKD13050.1 hypothetical protein MBM_08812 [Drepanopeziza brunnea f. sp. 'multigermtubi' MB_m1]KAJ5038263.1 hypothetical protein L3040_007130 [Drepanopeziza brunnea f. sp. 'multigermtubi']
MLRSKSISAILLPLSFLISVAQAWPQFLSKPITIGYATVTPDVAERINQQDGKLYVRRSFYEKPLGDGFYLVNDPLTWEGVHNSWYCAITAKKSAYKRLDKTFVPRTYWNQPESAIVDYLRSTTWVTNAETALRFSWIEGNNWALQMLIPKIVIEEDLMGLRAKCFQSRQERNQLTEEFIKWDDASLKGDRGPRHPPDRPSRSYWG